MLEQLADDPHALLGRLARAVHRFGGTLPQRPMVVDESIAEIGERKPAQTGDGVVGRQLAGIEWRRSSPAGRPRPSRHRVRTTTVHRTPTDVASGAMTSADDTTPGPAQRIAFLGPFGTFTEQALRTQPDLAGAELVACRTVPDVLDAVTNGEADAGFVPIENSIEGMVNFTLDALAFDHELVIVREVVLDIHLCLAARPGVAARRRQGDPLDPGGDRPVPPLPARVPADRRRAQRGLDGRRPRNS